MFYAVIWRARGGDGAASDGATSSTALPVGDGCREHWFGPLRCVLAASSSVTPSDASPAHHRKTQGRPGACVSCGVVVYPSARYCHGFQYQLHGAQRRWDLIFDPQKNTLSFR